MHLVHYQGFTSGVPISIVDAVDAPHTSPLLGQFMHPLAVVSVPAKSS